MKARPHPAPFACCAGASLRYCHHRTQISAAMVRCSDGSMVSVMIGDQAVQEYQVEQTNSGLARTTTCYIEAKEGDEFEVKASGLPAIKDGALSAMAFIDGKFVDHRAVCFNTSTITFKGYKKVNVSAQCTYQAFSFGKMQTTNDDSVKKLPSTEIQDLCTIRLEITVQKRIGPIDHVPSMQRSFEVPSSSLQHEDSKPALWGLSTKPGREIHIQGIYTCRCNVVDDADALRHVVIFKYFSHQWLVMKGLKEGNEEDDEVAIDVRRTDRTAARRRARLDLQPWTRNSRVKREGTAHSEAITIKDEDEVVRGLRITMEMTSDGEFVPVPRTIGDVIVIEDD